MATPRVFVSSTCYDLKYIRENLKYFIRTIGYEPILSDDGDVYYNPSIHTHDSCLREVSTCQLFVLIIGGRYGGMYKETDTSITNYEYREAVKSNIPVFALVENAVHTDHHIFLTNKKEKPDIFEKISYPSSDSIKIFNFLDEVRKSTVNNALYPFRDFSDMEAYLKKQWAGMMFDFLDNRLREAHSKITNRLLDDLSLATRKSEELMKILLKETQNDKAAITIQEVDNKVVAENFVRLVFSKFNIETLKGVTVQKLENSINAESWHEFLIKASNFHIEHIPTEDGSDVVLWGTGWGTGNKGLRIAVIDGDEYIPEKYHDMEKSFAALQALDKSTRKSILYLFVNGIK
ncbi:MAG: DUF4062 domain-containing protein [Deltaproteobacteria bacterium]|nr:DUF4062 domain-containing protein [Deltaproteobacteria bacterium]